MRPTSALIDGHSKILLSLSPNVEALIFLSKRFADLVCVPSAIYPNYLRSDFFSTLEPVNFTKWKWSWKTRMFSETLPQQVTETLRSRSKLVHAQQDAASQIMHVLSMTRLRAATGVVLQESVYAAKKIQAAEFKNSGYDEKTLKDLPYVTQHAQIAGVTAREAAGAILFAARLDDEMLLDTEGMRMRYLRRVAEAPDAQAVSLELAAFYRDIAEHPLS